MTVQELIQILEGMKPDRRVVLRSHDHTFRDCDAWTATAEIDRATRTMCELYDGYDMTNENHELVVVID